MVNLSSIYAQFVKNCAIHLFSIKTLKEVTGSISNRKKKTIALSKLDVRKYRVLKDNFFMNLYV